jgi:hypothetical protein
MQFSIQAATLETFGYTLAHILLHLMPHQLAMQNVGSKVYQSADRKVFWSIPYSSSHGVTSKWNFPEFFGVVSTISLAAINSILSPME